MPNPFQMAKQAIEMKKQVNKIQRDLQAQISEYENSGVKVSVNGEFTLLSLTIDPAKVDLSRIDRLERTITDNINKAHKLAKEKMQKHMLELARNSKDGPLSSIFGGGGIG